MAMEHKTISQKEYLKKYMSFGSDNEKKKKKQKKQKHKVGMKKVKIIDDDIDLKNIRPIEQGEFDILINGEDAPQIAGIIDERGSADFSDKKRWKIITEDEEGDLTITSRVDIEKRDQKYKKYTSEIVKDTCRPSANEDSSSSPPRQSKNYDSDLTPPRQSKNYDLDSSPPRRSKNYDSDISPPRRNSKRQTSTYNTSDRNYRNSGNRDSDLDLSPPRKRKENLETDFYENKRHRKTKDSDYKRSRSKERSRRRNSPLSDEINERRRKYKSSFNSNRQDASSSSKDKYLDHKSRSYSDRREKRRKSRWNEEVNEHEHSHSNTEHSKHRNSRMTKTLDGKRAGLQDAKALREETEEYNRREAEQFSKLSKAVSGVGQAAIVRKTGRKHDFEAEAAEKREREIQQRQIDEKYAKWGKGLKQTEDREEKLKNDLYEMNKPLARYADDADLDKQLREQDREGDPMLEYIKEKQIKEGKRKPDPPKYQGSYAPNRFGIKPGHRWDGVDRSNGYEKKWFESQNVKVARQEEAYKWSTADM